MEKLLDKLKSNSAKLDLEVDKYIYPFSDNNHFRSAEHLTDQEFFEAAFETVLSDLLSSSTNNSNEDICTLKDYGFALCYKKTEISEFFAAAATNVSEKKIIFFPDTIRDYLPPNADFYTELKATIEHELNHVRQVSCDCRINKGQKFSDIDIASIKEASAESATLKFADASIS